MECSKTRSQSVAARLRGATDMCTDERRSYRPADVKTSRRRSPAEHGQRAIQDPGADIDSGSEISHPIARPLHRVGYRTGRAFICLEEVPTPRRKVPEAEASPPEVSNI